MKKTNYPNHWGNYDYNSINIMLYVVGMNLLDWLEWVMLFKFVGSVIKKIYLTTIIYNLETIYYRYHAIFLDVY